MDGDGCPFVRFAFIAQTIGGTAVKLYPLVDVFDAISGGQSGPVSVLQGVIELLQGLRRHSGPVVPHLEYDSLLRHAPLYLDMSPPGSEKPMGNGVFQQGLEGKLDDIQIHDPFVNGELVGNLVVPYLLNGHIAFQVLDFVPDGD